MRPLLRKATIDDLEILVELRIEVLQDANHNGSGVDLSHLRKTTRSYYAIGLDTNTHLEYLAFVDDHLVGCGAASLYQVMPTCSNPSGKMAYIMNMYTRPEWRRKGIAAQILEKLVTDIHNKGIPDIRLETTKDGKPLYEKFGFRPMPLEMEYMDSKNSQNNST